MNPIIERLWIFLRAGIVFNILLENRSDILKLKKIEDRRHGDNKYPATRYEIHFDLDCSCVHIHEIIGKDGSTVYVYACTREQENEIYLCGKVYPNFLVTLVSIIFAIASTTILLMYVQIPDFDFRFTFIVWILAILMSLVNLSTALRRRNLMVKTIKDTIKI